MPERIKITNTTTVTQTVINLTGKDVAELLSKSGIDIPSNAAIEFHVPGGADWSNTAFDIDAEHPITVSWSETVHSHDGQTI